MANGKTICTACNYIYDESAPQIVRFDELPEQWKCPECGSSKELFQPCSCVSFHEKELSCVSRPEFQVWAEKTVGALVAEQPDRACIFEQAGIDYCCGGGKTLKDACASKKINMQDLITKLIATGNQSHHERNWTNATLAELVCHIIETYHEPLRGELPRVAALAEKVARVHGGNHPEMVKVLNVFRPFQTELELHMQKEEMVLFPGIVRMEAAGTPVAFGCGGGIQNPISMMLFEHESAGAALAEMRRLTNDYTPPADACNSFKVLLHSLAKLEAEMHQHVHKENNILFPRALKIAENKPVPAGA